MALAAPASATIIGPTPLPGDTCPSSYSPYGGEKVDTTGDPLSVTVTAPEGYLISGYCVKAGSAQQGDGPEFYEVDPPLKTVVITHSSGKAVSHYTPRYVPEPPASEWCSPGYWKNHPEQAWTPPGPTGNEPYSQEFGRAPLRSPKGVTDNAPVQPTIRQVIENPQWYGGEATENVADLLSDRHPDVNYTGVRIGNCPLV